jgi:DNA-binding transcriptional regulator YhcF (GntR family)
MPIDLRLEKHSPLPAYAQIEEQIKLALLLGHLRPGDTLPSIRDVEEQVGVSRNIVRKAYLELQRSGILTLRRGKGVLVEKDLKYDERASINEYCHQLSNELLEKLRQKGVSPSAFSRYLYQQAREQENITPFVIFVDATKPLAVERAAHISAIWQVNVPGFSLAELEAMSRPDLKRIRKILTNYIRYDEVRHIVKSGVDVIPLGLTFSPVTVREFSRLHSHANVVLILDDRDYPSLSLLLELYHKILIKPTVKLSALPLSEVKDLQKLVASSKYDKLIFSNRIWDDLSDTIKRNPRVTRPHMDVDLGSLESARIDAGVVI